MYTYVYIYIYEELFSKAQLPNFPVALQTHFFGMEFTAVWKRALQVYSY